MVNDTRLSLSTLIIHVYIARPARGAKHLLTTTRTTHDRSTRGNFGLAAKVASTPDGVRVEFANGSVVDGDLLIGADGLHSKIRDVRRSP